MTSVDKTINLVKKFKLFVFPSSVAWFVGLINKNAFSARMNEIACKVPAIHGELG